MSKGKRKFSDNRVEAIFFGGEGGYEVAKLFETDNNESRLSPAFP